MKQNFFLIFCLALLAGCDINKGFTIDGVVPDVENGRTIYLVALAMNSQWDTLGMSIVENGKFKIEGKIPEPRIAQIRGIEKRQSIPLFLENVPFLVKVTGERPVVTGGELQRISNEFNDVKAEIYKDMPEMEKAFREAREQKNWSRCEQLIKEEERLDSIYNEAERQILAERGNTLVAVYLVSRHHPKMRFERLKPMYDRLSEEMKNSPYGQVITQRYRDAKITAVGEIAPDFTLLTPEGDSLSLYSVKAKVKVLDFWASWCGPCRAENPNIQKVYQKYKAAGLEVISVSFDTKKEAWLQAIREDNLGWIHLSDLKGLNSIASDLYEVHGIPHVFVLDENNRIIAERLRGKELEECVAKALREVK